MRRDYNYPALYHALTGGWQHTRDIAATLGWPSDATLRYLRVAKRVDLVYMSRDGAGCWWRASPTVLAWSARHPKPSLGPAGSVANA